LTAGDNSLNDFADNQLTCVPENIFPKNLGVKIPRLTPGKFRGSFDPLNMTSWSLVPTSMRHTLIICQNHRCKKKRWD